jgi:3-oxoacyl-[acyl-carrier-protein] synthase III
VAVPLGIRAAGIAGLGIALPETVVTNDDWAQRLETSDEWIVARTGIRQRRRAAPSDTTVTLAIGAARAALADAAMDRVDAVVVATTTPDMICPQVAPRVAKALGLDGAAFDVGAGCSGFVYALAVAQGLISAGVASDVLVVGAEVMSPHIDPQDRTTAVLFGDGAGAAVLSSAAEGSLGPFDLGSDGGLFDALQVPAGAPYLQMRGAEIYRHAIERMVSSSQRVLAAAGLNAGEIDAFVPHQANARILEAVARRLDIDDEHCVVTVDRHGNTSAASIPLALAEARREGRLSKGDRVLLTAFGAGLTWGSALVEWGTA